jgi:hypothetical protein
MSPVQPISNIYAIRIVLTLLICGALTTACERAETRTAAVTTTTPSGSATAPSAAAASSRDEALVRVVHAIPFAAAMDVYAGDLLAFNGVGFKSVTTYRALDGKRYAFMLRPAGMTNAKPLATNTEALEDGSYYSVFALPGDGRNAVLRVVGDRLDRPANGKSRLRIVHAGDGLETLDIRTSPASEALLAGVKFRDVTDYRDVEAFNGAIEVRSGDRNVLALPNAHLEPGRFYTMVIVGRVAGSPPLEAFIIEDHLSRR